MQLFTTEKKYLWFLFLIIFPLYLTWTFDHSLWNPDETRDAGIAREMWVTKDFVTPHLNGEPFLEKPPLYYWTCSLVYAVTGRVTDGLTRLPAALYGFIGILFTFLIGRSLFDARTGWMAAAMLATVGQYFRMSHFALMDSSLAALLTGAFYFYLTENLLLFFLFTVLAFYTKGFVAVALAGVVVGAHLLIQKKWKRLALITALGIPFFAIAVGPWIYGLWKAGGMQALRIFFVDNNWNRFASGKVDHAAPFYYYFGSFPMDFLPWTLVFIPALLSLKKMKGPAIFFVKTWFLAIFILLSIASGKRSMYLLPIFPAAAIFCAAWLKDKKSGQKIFSGFFGAAVATIIIGDIFFIKRLDQDKTFLPVVQAIEVNRSDSELAGFDLSEMERGVLPFYLGEQLRNFKTVAELDSYFQENPKKPLLLVTNRNKLTDEGSKGLAPLLDQTMKPVFTYREDKKTRSYLLYKKS